MTLSYDGILEEMIYSVSGCRHICLSNPNCFAFDFDKVYMLCYIHTAGYIKNIQSPVTNVDQYRREFCVDGGMV